MSPVVVIKYGFSKKFSDLYSDYYPLIVGAVYSKVSTLGDAEDITQEVFIKFYQKLEDIENKRKWLYGALRLEILSYYKKKKGKEVNVDEVFQDVSLTFVNGFRDLRIVIQEVMDDMDNFGSEQDRIIFELKAICHFSYEKCAKQLGVSIKKVRYRYDLIVKNILQHLREKGITSLEDLL